jgi:hypothetical protein
MSRNTKQSNQKDEVNELPLPGAAEPRDRVRLIRAFLAIKEPGWREKLIHLAEDLAKASFNCLGTEEVGETHELAFRSFDALANPAENDMPVPGMP